MEFLRKCSKASKNAAKSISIKSKDPKFNVSFRRLFHAYFSHRVNSMILAKSMAFQGNGMFLPHNVCS